MSEEINKEQEVKSNNITFIRDEKTGKINWFKTIPLECTLLETDNSNYTIKEIYKQYALFKQLDEEVIKKQLYLTFADIFKLNLR
jgi:Tat protein secretion system quality control protein TatD with DNase activity